MSSLMILLFYSGCTRLDGTLVSIHTVPRRKEPTSACRACHPCRAFPADRQARPTRPRPSFSALPFAGGPVPQFDLRFAAAFLFLLSFVFWLLSLPLVVPSLAVLPSLHLPRSTLVSLLLKWEQAKTGYLPVYLCFSVSCLYISLSTPYLSVFTVQMEYLHFRRLLPGWPQLAADAAASTHFLFSLLASRREIGLGLGLLEGKGSIAQS